MASGENEFDHPYVFQNCFFSPPPSRNSRWFFFFLHGEDLVNLLEIKFQNVWESPVGPLSGVFAASLQQFVKYAPGFPTQMLLPEEASALVNCESLYLPLCLSNIWGSALPCDFPSLIDLRKVFAFSYCPEFYLLLGQNEAPYMSDQKPAAQYCYISQIMKHHSEKQSALSWVTGWVNSGTETQLQVYL